MATVAQKATSLLQGMQSQFPNQTTPVVVNGQSYTVAELILTLSSFLALVGAVSPAEIQFHQAVQAVKAKKPPTRELVSALSSALRNLFGKGNPMLVHFGISAGLRKAPTPKTKVSAGDQAKATRAVRHTLGKKQKLRIRAVQTAPSGSSTPGK